jgi:Tfp pilus assembly protein PilP
MKRLHKITLLAVWLFAFSIVVSPLSAEARDPFSPFSSSGDKKNKKTTTEKPAKEAETEGADETRNPSISIRNPLTSAPLDNYKLAAVLLTPKDSFAVVKAANGMQYIARKNDRVGNEGGRITEITVDNIKVKHAEDEVKIPVSNFAEALSVEETEISPE